MAQTVSSKLSVRHSEVVPPPFVMAVVGKALEAVVLKPIAAPFNLLANVAQGRGVVAAVAQAAVDIIPIASLTQYAYNRRRGCRVLVHDYSNGVGLLGVTWAVAGTYTACVGRFDVVIRATSWSQVATRLREIADEHGGIFEVQYWGHGCPGHAFIGGDALNEARLSSDEWARLRDVFAPDGVWWFRTCSTFNEDAGRRFARTFSAHFGVRVAGHTVFIHALQGGLVVLSPGEEPAWEDGGGSHCLCTDMCHHALGNKL